MSAPGPTQARSFPSLGDRRGLTATGAVLVALLVALAAALFDVSTGNGLREVFAVGFVTGCLAAALSAHREDLVAMVVMPPLLYAVVAVVAGIVEKAGTGALLTQQALELTNALLLGAPVLVAGTLAAAVVALVRWAVARR